MSTLFCHSAERIPSLPAISVPSSPVIQVAFFSCHPSAQTLGSSLFIIIKTLYFNVK
ncbi:MAG: hypothetical protein ACR5LA_07860 [Wolbachia sp.]